MGRLIRRDETEKSEIIHIVEHSALPVKKTLDELQVPRSTFYRWYKLYQEEGKDGLIDHRPNPRQIWNRIPKEVKQQVVDLALQHPDRSPRQIAWLFTDEKGYFISESSTYRILKGFDLVESPAFTVMSAAEKFQHPTTHGTNCGRPTLPISRSWVGAGITYPRCWMISRATSSPGSLPPR